MEFVRDVFVFFVSRLGVPTCTDERLLLRDYEDDIKPYHLLKYAYITELLVYWQFVREFKSVASAL